ncbi:hypothetical protein F5Y19DRAFT_408383 [Xylariaceae sp. FL1651]|nr:hypothetical protein F5Y19DRAFT_408383 [Xylariaceae sp. FL1651]
MKTQLRWCLESRIRIQIVLLNSYFTQVTRVIITISMAQLPRGMSGSGERSPRFVISIDYGTTYTGAAWILTTAEPSKIEDINVVMKWPGGNEPKVPSVFTYSANSGEQWGYGIGDNAYVIEWTKMQLERPSRLEALDALWQTLQEAEQLDFGQRTTAGRIPRHLTKTPSNVMTDYLTRVAAVVYQDIRNKKDEEVLKKFPIDLVITHPAIWDARARNATFRAVVEAFESEFSMSELPRGNIRLVTESEACAQYTMHEKSIDDLKKGDCFIVVDAGGGTVDLVSYRVDTVNPNFRVSRVTEVSSGRYGATRIDDCFLHKFLPGCLGEREYERFLAIGTLGQEHGSGAHMVLRRGERMMLDKFQVYKLNFKGKGGPGQHANNSVIKIDLPEGIGEYDDPAHNIENGRLRITSEDLEQIFKESVDGTLDLIQQQIIQIDDKRLKVKAIFLSGGFSRNEYLYGRVRKLAQNWRLKVHRGEDSWTAVVKGAALMGLGIGCEMPAPNSSSSHHIGVVLAEQFARYSHRESQKYTDTFDNIARAKDHVKWIVAKGDLLTPHEGIEKKVKIIQKVTRTGKKAGRVIVVLSGHENFGETPSQLSRLLEIHDVSRKVVNLDYDLGSIPESDRRNCYKRVTDPESGITYHKVEMQLVISVTIAGGIRLDLMTGSQEDYFGRTTREGYRLAVWSGSQGA